MPVCSGALCHRFISVWSRNFHFLSRFLNYLQLYSQHRKKNLNLVMQILSLCAKFMKTRAWRPPSWTEDCSSCVSKTVLRICSVCVLEVCLLHFKPFQSTEGDFCVDVRMNPDVEVFLNGTLGGRSPALNFN